MGNMFCFSTVLLVVGVIEYRGQCFPKGEGSVIALVKIPCNKVNKGKIKTKVMGHIFQAECWEKHLSVGVHIGLLWLGKMAKDL